MPLRVMPELGTEVRIEYLGTTVRGVVRGIEAEGRQLEVVAEDGTVARFALNRATATFTQDGRLAGARLRF